MPTDSSGYRINLLRGGAVPTNPRTSVIVLVTDDTAMLSRCLQAVDATAPRDDPVELVIVANGTPAHALASLEQRPDVVLIRSPVNLGFAGGCNLAVRCAAGERLVFLNDDVTVTPGWLEGLHQALDRNPDVAVAGGKVILGSDRLQEAGSVLWRDGSTSGVGRGADPDSVAFSAPRMVDYVSFCCAMVRRSAWHHAGGFDERFFPVYYEDLDLCLTLHELGWRVMYQPTAVVHHTEGASASRGYRHFISRRNQAKFVAKWGAVLSEYENPPANDAERPAAEKRALRRAAERRLPTRTHDPAHASESVQPLRAIPDGEALAIEVRHLSAAAEVNGEYIRMLEGEAAARGMRRVRVLVGASVRRVRQHLRGAGIDPRRRAGRR